MFGPAVEHPVNDVTPTHLTQGVLTQLREADSRAYRVLKDSGSVGLLSQMPVVSIPIHFDRAVESILTGTPSCQHSMVIRTFITADFMTGIPATPGKQIPEKVSAYVPSYCVYHVNLLKMRSSRRVVLLYE